MTSDGGRFGRHKIRGVYYPTYRAVRAEIKKRLAKYPLPDQAISDEDVEWFVDLIREMHPYADEKLSKRVVGIRKYSRLGASGDNLMLLYADGSSDPFSWNKCCKSKRSSDGTTVKNALRTAVQDQTSAVMDRAFLGAEEILCPMSGERIARQAAHVDHAPPRFAELVQAWLAHHGIAIDDVPLADEPHGGAVVAAGEMLDSWRSFHEQHAVLRVVSARWNTSKEGRDGF
jgi:hypothetical protein